MIWFKFSSLVNYAFLRREQGRRKTLYFYLNSARVPPPSDKEDNREQPEWGRAQSSEDISQANSGLIYITAWEFQQLSDRRPDTFIHSARCQRKCQVHHHFKPLLVLWLKKKYQ